MKCNALPGVGQGSSRGSYIVTMEWKGNKNKKTFSFCWERGLMIQEVYL